MKLGFICPNASGHLYPMTALARQLKARNHDVVFLYLSDAAGLPFVPGPGKDDIHETVAEVSKLEGEEALKFGMSWLMTQTETILKSAGNCTSKPGRCAGNRYRSVLCRIGCDAVGYAVHTCVTCYVPRLQW